MNLEPDPAKRPIRPAPSPAPHPGAAAAQARPGVASSDASGYHNAAVAKSAGPVPNMGRPPPGRSDAPVPVPAPKPPPSPRIKAVVELAHLITDLRDQDVADVTLADRIVSEVVKRLPAVIERGRIESAAGLVHMRVFGKPYRGASPENKMVAWKFAESIVAQLAMEPGAT